MVDNFEKIAYPRLGVSNEEKNTTNIGGYSERSEVMIENHRKSYSVIKWRGMNQIELWIWAHLRLDRIEKILGLNYKTPDLEEIAQKLQDEATEKEYYTPDTYSSIFPQFITKGLIKLNSGFRYCINCILRPNEAMEQLLAITTATGMSCEGQVGGLGAMCGECTATPLLTNKATLSPGCPGSRREAFLAEDELFLSMPYQLYNSTVVASR